MQEAPVEADIEVQPAFFLDGVENLAGNEEISKEILPAIDAYDKRFTSQRADWAENVSGLWNQMDAAFRSFINNLSVSSQAGKGANEPANQERSKIASSQFHRQVTQMAANGYSVQTGKPMPFRYDAIQDGDFDAGETDAATQRAKKLNLLAKWSMKKDRFDLKCIDFWTQIKKYGNIPVMVEWSYVKGTKTIRIPIVNDEGEIESYDFQEVDGIKENRPEFSLLPIESLKADTMIGNIQDQECVILSSVVGLSSIISGIEAGFYRSDLIESLTNDKQWDGYAGFENGDEKKQNRDLTSLSSGSSTSSGQYLKREIFINAPIEDGEWDEKKNVPMRYRVTLFGNDVTSSAVARIERNQEPDDTIPIEMIHANPDDPDFLYHISDYEIVRSNLSVETTLMRQIIDNGAMVNKFVTWEVRGEVEGNDREIKAGQRFVVDSPNSMGQFPVRDISQSAMSVLGMIRDDSNNALSIDKNMQGESFGARTSASEAGTISNNSKRPNLVNIEYVLEQLLGFVAKRYQIGWETYGLEEQVIQITNEEDKPVFIKPTDLHGEFDIVVDIMDDIKDDAVQVTRMINYIQTVGSIPQLAQTMDWKMISEHLSEKMLGTSKFVTGKIEGDAEKNARENLYGMFANGQFPEMDDAMNLETHLRIYEDQRLRLRGSEEENQEGVDILEQVIAQIKARMASPHGGSRGGPQDGSGPGGQGVPQQAPVGENEAMRQEVSGAIGGEGGV